MSNIVRKSNVELLRILAIMGVIVLHYNNRLYGNAFGITEGTSINHMFLKIAESICICSVDLFVIISAFFLSKTQRRNGYKIIDLLIQLVLFSIVRYIIGVRGHIVFKALLVSMIPNNYFVTLYATLYIISPLINYAMSCGEAKNTKRIVFTMFILFSVIPFIVDVINNLFGIDLNGLSTVGLYGNQWGYTIVNFVLLYFWGSYIDDMPKVKCKWMVLAGIFLVMIITLISYWNERVAWEYCSPFVILLACCIFKIFIEFDIGEKRIINELSGGVFTCFLIHDVFVRHIRIEYFASQNVLMLFVHLISCSIIIYIFSYIVWKIYSSIVNRLTSRIDKTKFEIVYSTK